MEVMENAPGVFAEMPYDVSFCIARQLAGLWTVYRGAEFQHYFHPVYGGTLPGTPRFECMYIAEADAAKIDTGSFGSIVKNWWRVDDMGIQAIRSPRLPDKEDGAFDARPIIRFYYKDHHLLVGETLGPTLMCRKRGTLDFLEKDVALSELKMLWTSTGQSTMPDDGSSQVSQVS